MSLITNNNNKWPVLPGQETILNSNVVLSAKVGGSTNIPAGTIVSLDEWFNTDGVPTVTIATGTSKKLGVVLHQNIRTEVPGESPANQTFLPGENVGVVSQGFVTALGEAAFDNTDITITATGTLTKGGTDISAANLKPTGAFKMNDQIGKMVVEVEIK